MIDEALEHLVKGIVDSPEDVVVKEKTHRRGTTLEVRVNPEDIGKVIGRNGRTARRFVPSSARSQVAQFVLIWLKLTRFVNP
jgi:predicted RNA-binding protein YlqC (UPF0109 family)